MEYGTITQCIEGDYEHWHQEEHYVNQEFEQDSYSAYVLYMSIICSLLTMISKS